MCSHRNRIEDSRKMPISIFAHLEIRISRCNPSTDSTCANDSYYSASEATIKTFSASPVFIDTNVSPADQNYKDFFFN